MKTLELFASLVLATSARAKDSTDAVPMYSAPALND